MKLLVTFFLTLKYMVELAILPVTLKKVLVLLTRRFQSIGIDFLAFSCKEKLLSEHLILGHYPRLKEVQLLDCGPYFLNISIAFSSM